MAKVAVFVDGFNLYHAISAHAKYRRYKWLNLRRLAGLYVHGHDSLEAILYFTTLATWDMEKAARHKVYVRALENEGVSIVYGEFKRKQKHCRLCNKDSWGFEEKQTDVNIALSLFQLAVADRYDKAVIISGDTDLLPAVKAVRATFPAKQIGVVIPIGRASEDFKKQADFHYKMRERHLASCRFQDVLTLRDKSTVQCPESWK